MRDLLKPWRENWGLIFLVPLIACIVCLAHLAAGSRADWDFSWCGLALIYMAAQMVKLVLQFTQAGRHPEPVLKWKAHS